MSGSSPTDEEISSLAREFALLNAVSHGGRADRGSVIGRIMAEKADLRRESKRVSSIVERVVFEVNKLSVDEQRASIEREFPDSLDEELRRKKEVSKKDSEKEPELPPLPEAVEGNVVTRFPPEPNGFMHIGHAKAAVIGSEYAKKYRGKFIMRFDDTNPSAEKKEYYDAFIESFKWLGIKPDVIRNASDDIERFYHLAEQMMAQSNAYVCACPQDMMRDLRGKGMACEHRAQSPADSISLWRKMLSGEIARNAATLRFAGDMKSTNTTMRDPVLFRIVEEPHPLKGSQYRVWPTYDFDGPVEDSLDGVTHAMRSKEYELRDELYHAILRSLALREPMIVEFSRLNLQNTTVSKRSLKRLIEEHKVQGWDDPRLPTIMGLKRRGFLPEAIKEFILSMGVSKVESQPTWDLLESINRKMLDPIAKRYFFVPDPIELEVEGAPELDVRLRYHPESDYGERTVHTSGYFLVPSQDVAQLSPGDKMRLIEAYTVEITGRDRGRILAKKSGEDRLVGMPKVQWVVKDDNVPVSILVLGPLLVGDEFNSESLKTVSGAAEKSVSAVEVGSIFQFVRFGFCRMDSPGRAILTHK